MFSLARSAARSRAAGSRVGLLPGFSISRVGPFPRVPVSPMYGTQDPLSARRLPMVLTDQHGAVAFAWFPEGTRADPAHVLPLAVYAEVCRLAGVPVGSPWVAFARQADAVTAAVAACLAAGCLPGR